MSVANEMKTDTLCTVVCSYVHEDECDWSLSKLRCPGSVIALQLRTGGSVSSCRFVISARV